MRIIIFAILAVISTGAAIAQSPNSRVLIIVIDYGQWHTLTATFDRDGMMRLYTDGVFNTEEDISMIGSMNNDTGYFFGADIDSEYNYTGAIGEVRFWSTVLSDEAISDYACASIDANHPNYSDLAAYWKMDEDEGIHLNNSSMNSPYLHAESFSGEWQVPEATVSFDYSATPRLVDAPFIAMTHMCVDVLEAWDLDGIS